MKNIGSLIIMVIFQPQSRWLTAKVRAKLAAELLGYPEAREVGTVYLQATRQILMRPPRVQYLKYLKICVSLIFLT